MMNTSGSRRISSAMASRNASRMVIVTISVPAGTSGSGSVTAAGADGAFFSSPPPDLDAGVSALGSVGGAVQLGRGWGDSGIGGGRRGVGACGPPGGPHSHSPLSLGCLRLHLLFDHPGRQGEVAHLVVGLLDPRHLHLHGGTRHTPPDNN